MLVILEVCLCCALFAGLDFLTFCDGSTVRCVDLRPESDCVPVILCFLKALAVPPPFSLNNSRDFIPFSRVEQFNKSNSVINETSANLCIVHEAFDDGPLEIRIAIQDSGTTTFSNPVTLHANPGMKCLLNAVCKDI